MNNIKFNYLYRDAGNYKNWGSILLRNPENLSVQFVTQALQRAFLEASFFAATQIRVPEHFAFEQGHATSDDHCFHEFDSVELTAESVNDVHLRTVTQFIEEIEKQSARGWTVFDPHEAKNGTRIS